MKKIKNFYKEHRVFTILMAIVIVCFVLITTIFIQCFYVGNGTDKYGNRLDNIDTYKIEDSRLTEFKTKYKDEKAVETIEIHITGKIIYIEFYFDEGIDLVEAQSIALKSLDDFNEEEQKYYDFNITLKQNKTETIDGFLISGAKNANGTGLTWNNNRTVIVTEGE